MGWTVVLWGMSIPRALAEPGRPGLYHVCSRVVDRRVIFGERERRKFMELIKGGAVFAGVDVVSWCLMGNHFHLLVRVLPMDADDLSDEEVLARMESIYREPRMRHYRGVWERMETTERRRDFLAPFRARMGSLSEYVRTLKQRFTQWFNRSKGREGTLWEGRFHSVLLSHNESEDGRGLGLLARFVAGYIDLNPVRAGVVREASESDWSGYGAALRGDGDGVAGLRILWGSGVTAKMDSRSVLEMHGRMLGRACVVKGDGVASGDGRGLSRWDKPESEGAVGQVGRDPHVQAVGRYPVGSGDGGGRQESEVLSRMCERCEALTKGRVLGGRWLGSFGGAVPPG